MTSLIDVVLLLVIFVMVSTSFVREADLKEAVRPVADDEDLGAEKVGADVGRVRAGEGGDHAATASQRASTISRIFRVIGPAPPCQVTSASMVMF